MGKSRRSRIIGQFHDGDVFSYNYEKNGWVNVVYCPADSSDRIYLDGYIHKDRLLDIFDLPCVLENNKPVKNGHLTLHRDSLTVELIATPFRPKQHALRKGKFGDVQKIDGKRPLGTDAEMPLEQLAFLRITIGGQAVDISPAAWDNLYDPTLETCRVFADTVTGFMYIHLLSTRSAAAGYDVVWIFKSGRYVKRYVDQSKN
jgi:hypothetical protein